MNILIVDDEKSIRDYITQRVERWGYHSQCAASGKQALQKFSGTSFDLILLDIILPDFKGYDLIPEFRKIDPGIEVITITGHNSRELELKVRKKGILYYMVKPIETENLRLLLEHLNNNKG